MSPSAEAHAQRKLTDSPWFWVLVFSAAAVVFLLGMTPKYAQRQSQLELQYQARQEIARRQVEGHEPREADDEIAVSPPAPGEVLIELWPLVTMFAALAAVSAIMLWRAGRPRPPVAANAVVSNTPAPRTPAPDTPAGPA